MKLSDRNWKEFYLSELFINFHGKRLIKKIRKMGNIPLLTAGFNNNGISDFISNDNMKSYLDCITIDMFGYAFYHPYKCCGDDNIYFFLNKKISKYAKLFIVTCLNNHSNRFSYANQFRQTDADNSRVYLPMNSTGQPDYEFMEEYMREKENKLKKQYKNFVISRVDKTYEKPAKPKEWKEFNIENIFSSIKRGKRLIKDNQIKGNVPYISSSSLNNGIDNFINNKENVRIYKHCLSLANSGSVGTCFYEPFEFIASDHITHLKGNLSKYQYLFLINSVQQIKIKYNFNREINDNRIKKEKIILPVTYLGQPDYQYMENYMKYLEQQKLLEYLKFIEGKNNE